MYIYRKREDGLYVYIYRKREDGLYVYIYRKREDDLYVKRKRELYVCEDRQESEEGDGIK